MKQVVAGIDIDVIVNVGDLSMKNVGILKQSLMMVESSRGVLTKRIRQAFYKPIDFIP